MNEKKRKFMSVSDVYNADNIYKFNVLLPNGINVPIVKRNPENESILLETFIQKVKEKCALILRQTEGSSHRRKIFWNSKELFLEDYKGKKITNEISFEQFKPNKLHFLKLFDGAGQTADTFEYMWDLTPNTDLLTELPDDYTFETALADLIDNSLQAVWTNGKGERKLISVEIDEDEVSVFDNGPGMDGSNENSIVKWGKMGASVHRSSKKLAIGGKPPYLTPYFGMFGYGGTIASMHLGRYAVVSGKTKESNEVYWLRLDRDALLKRTGDLSWKAAGGIRDPLDSEIEMSPHGSFTKIVMKPKLSLPDIFQLQCKLKDIYFPYIQCDEISSTGRTTTLVEFQINGINLAEIEGGEVAVTNLNSCNGPEFVLNLHFSIEEDRTASVSSSETAVREGNARLKCLYFPVTEGKEAIERILEKLNRDGFDIKEDYETFSRISVRRLGRLLPDARWELLPFMKPKQKRGSKVQTLKRCCSRVKCFIDTDAGFNPIPSKTDLAPQHPFTKALKDLGHSTDAKGKVVNVGITRDGKQLTPQQLERDYQNWILQMHIQYDDECNLGDDEPIWLTSVSNKEALHVTCDVVRVHEMISRKGNSWSRGQKVKFLKGACAGCHKNNIFATLEYFLLEGCEKDAGGEAQIICRPLGVAEEDGSVLTNDASGTSLELHSSLSLSINAIYSGKCIAVSDNEWNVQAEKHNQKLPSTIEVLGPEQIEALDIDGALPTEAEISAGSLSPKEIAAVLRPSNFSPSNNANGLDQKLIVRGNYEMCLDIKFKAGAGKSSKMDQIFSGTVTNTSRKGCPGLYIFSMGCIRSLFQKAGAYSFSFSLKNSAIATVSCEKIVRVKALSKIKRWELLKNDQNPTFSLSAGSYIPSFSVVRYDEYDNIIPFKTTPEIEAQLLSNGVLLSHLKNAKVKSSLDMLSMNISNLQVTTDNLDDIRPNYEATLALSFPDVKQPFLSIPCLVFPGPIRFVRYHSSAVGKELLPKQVLEDIQLEMLDKHLNHVKEGEVEVELHGFDLLDQIGLKRKVDIDGYLDLSGILKVTESYGKPASLSVKSNEKVIFNKIFQVEKRELRMVTKVPELCLAGSELKNITFEVVNSAGQIDHAIHDDDKHSPHTLKILTDLPDTESLRYAFRQGRCVIPSVTLPQREGIFCIEAVYFQHRDLRVKFEVSVSRSPTEYDTTSNLQASEEEMIRERTELHDSDSPSRGLEELDDDFSTPLEERFTPVPISDIAKLMKTRKEVELQDSKSPSGGLEELNDDISTPLEERVTPVPVSDIAKHVKTRKEVELQDSEDTVRQSQNESARLSPLQTSNVKQGILFPSTQDTLAETPIKLSDPPTINLSDSNDEDDDDLFNTPERSILLRSNAWDLEDFSAEAPIKFSVPNNEHGNDLFKSPEVKKVLLGSDLLEIKSVEKEIHNLGSRIKSEEDDLDWYKQRREDVNKELTQLKGKIEVLPLPSSHLVSVVQKEDVLENIGNKVDSAAAIYSTASQKLSLEVGYPEFSADVVGIVALLATVSTFQLSRSLAAYVGEDQMLGIVSQSSAAIKMPDKYEDVLVSLADELGRIIKRRQLIICLEDIRPFDGDVLENDRQRRLELPYPTLPDETIPLGFLGYAVNMINLDVNYVQFRTVTGRGLRETLFYQLFGELQVYDTREHMIRARNCITQGAVSLDGGIFRGKGIISLGSGQVDVLFPVAAEEPESSNRTQVMRRIEELNNELKLLEEELIPFQENVRESSLKDFQEKKDGYLKQLEEKAAASQKLLLSQQSFKSTPRAPSSHSP